MEFAFDLKNSREEEFGILVSVKNNTYVGVIAVATDERQILSRNEVKKTTRVGYNLFLTFVERNERQDFVSFFTKGKNKKVVIDTNVLKTDETALNILTDVDILEVVKKTLIDNKENIEENSFKTDLSKYYDNFHKNFLVFGEAVENEFNLTTMNFFYSLENKPVLPLTPCDASLFRLFNKKDLKEIKIIQIDDIQVFKTINNFLLIGSPRAKSNPTYYLPCKFKKKDLGTLEIDNFLFGENFTKFDNHLKILCDKENSNLTMNVYKANESDLIESKTIKYNFISYV